MSSKYHTLIIVGLLLTIVFVSVSLLTITAPPNLAIPTLASLNEDDSFTASPAWTGNLSAPVNQTVIQADIDLNTASSIGQQAIIRFSSLTDQAEIDEVLQTLKVERVEDLSYTNGSVVLLNQPIADEQIQAISSIVMIEPNYRVQSLNAYPPNDPMLNQQWSLNALNIANLWQSLPDNGADVTIAVIDSGICASHPDLQGRILSGYDFIDDDNIPNDLYGHGCAVSGIIAANINNGIGIAGLVPHVKILPIRVLNDKGIGTYADVSSAIHYAVDNGASIINLSLGGQYPSQILQEAVNYATQHNVKIVAGAGNTGQAGVFYPAAYPDVIAVGSSDQNGNQSTFSSYGSELDTLAPGENILTTTLNGGYGLFSGTSMAVPHVTALLAMNRSITMPTSTAPTVTPTASPSPSATLQAISSNPNELEVTALSLPTSTLSASATAIPWYATASPIMTITPYPMPTLFPAVCSVTVPAGNVSQLVTAFQNAQTNTSIHTICLTKSTYTLSDYNNSGTSGRNGLPLITRNLVLLGNGATITRNDSPEFRYFEISPSASFKIKDVNFVKGGATYGGIIYNNQGKLISISSTFKNGTATDGGAIYNDRGSAEIIKSVFELNTGFYGGAIYSNSGYPDQLDSLFIIGSSFIHNTASLGGAIISKYNFSVYQTRFIGNEALSNYAVFSSGVSYPNLKFADNCIYGNISPSQLANAVTTSSIEYNWWGNPLGPETYLLGNLPAINNRTEAILACMEADSQDVYTYIDQPANIVLEPAQNGDAPYTYSALESHGSAIALGSHPNYTLVPLYSQPATQTFSYTATDANNYSVTGLVKLKSFAHLFPHTISATVDWGMENQIVVGVGEGIPPLTYSDFSIPSGGTINGTGPIIGYTPNESFGSEDVITYKVTDARGESATNTLVINLSALTADDLSLHTNLNATIPIPIAPISSTGGIPPYIWEFDELPSMGNIAGTLPNIDYIAGNTVGFDSFSYTITDAHGQTATATIDVAICDSANQTFTIPDGDTDYLVKVMTALQLSDCFTGTNTIELAENGHYEFTNYALSIGLQGYTALPMIKRPITINGNGASLRRTGTDFSSRVRFLYITANATIRDLSLEDGLAIDSSTNYGRSGGSILINGGTVTLENILFKHSNALEFGNALYIKAGNVTILNSAFVGNATEYFSAVSKGAAIYNSGTLSVTNSSFLDNGIADAVIYNSGTATLTHNTFSGAKHWANIRRSSGSLTLKGNILGKTTTTSCIGTSINSNGYNLSFDSSCTNLIKTGDVNNANLSSRQIMYPDTIVNPILPVAAYTAAVDAIPVASCTLTTDIWGLARAVDDNGDPSSYCDIGAYESHAYNIGITKTVDNANPQVDEHIHFTIEISNNGAIDMHDVAVLDELPQELVYVDASATQGTFDATSGLWSVGNLQVGESASMILEVSPLYPVAGNTVTNTATVASSSAFDVVPDLSKSVDIHIQCPTTPSNYFTINDGDTKGLIQAINIANDETCSPGQDSISLAPDGNYDFTQAYTLDSALPEISSDLIINGQGATLTQSTIPLFNVYYFRFLKVSALGNLHINDTIFSEGYLATQPGGAIYSLGNLTLNASTFIHNGGASGGAIFQDGGTISVVDSTFSKNYSIVNYIGGGALRIDNAQASILGSTFTDNTANMASYTSTQSRGGGAIRLYKTDTTIEDSTFDGNTARYAFGGAIESVASATYNTMSVDSSIFRNSEAQYGGGIFTTSYHNLTIENSAFEANVASTMGGGLYPNGYDIVRNTTFSGNSAQSGSAIGMSGAHLQLTHSTIAYNFDSSGSGAFDNHGTALISYSLFVGNTRNCDSQVGIAESGGYNISDDTYCNLRGTADQNNVEVPLSAFGYHGNTLPSAIPLAGSPAIDAIPLADCTLTQDQVGSTRPYGAGCDIGAIEVNDDELFAPSNVMLEEFGLTLPMKLSWDDVEQGQSLYEIIHLYTPDSTGVIVSEAETSLAGTAREYDIDTPSLMCDAHHQYQIRSYDSSTNRYSDFVSSASIYIPCYPMATPTNLTANYLYSNVILHWSYPYRPYFDVYEFDGIRWQKVADSLTSFLLILPDRDCSATYQYRIRARTTTNISDFSDIVTLDTDPCVLYPPDNLTIVANETNGIDLTWTDPNKDETDFTIERSLDENDWTEIAVLPVDSVAYTDEAIEGETTYYYRLRSGVISKNLYSDYSAIISTTSLKTRQLGPVIVVNTTSDNNVICLVESCSLREAITMLNTRNISGTVEFDLTGGAPYELQLSQNLPDVITPIVFDGWSQSSWVDKPIIWLNANGKRSFRILDAGDGSVIRGFVITGASEGIKLDHATDITIVGNYIGINPDGTAAIANNVGIYSMNSNATIGGTLAHERNVISGNTTDGIYAYVSTLNIQNNIIGLNAAGTLAQANQAHGINFYTSTASVVGGTEANSGNLISGNGQYGIKAIDREIIQGNFIGTDITGTIAIPNGLGGIIGGELIGGNEASAGNLISGNSGPGITANAIGIVIKGNIIGLDITGTQGLANRIGIIGGITGQKTGLWISDNIIAGNIFDGVQLKGQENTLVRNYIGQNISGTSLPNSGNGIFIDDAESLYNVIGGATLADANIIAHNGGDGIALIGQANIAINQISNNDGLGIDVLDDDTYNSNDYPDGDSILNYPEIDIVALDGDQLHVMGSITAKANTSYQIYLYQNASCDASGSGEGETYLAKQTVTSDGLGYALIDISLTATVNPTDVFTMMASNIVSSTSSEFSPCVGISPAGYLQAPTNLQANNITETSLSLNWQDNSSDETAFVIEQLVSGTWTQVDTVISDVSNADLSGLSCKTNYSFRVRAYRSGDDTYSAGGSVFVQTSLCQPPSDPDIYVTVTEDVVDGVCDSHCSLREAIDLANSVAGIQTIHIPAGTYPVVNNDTLSFNAEDENLTGDLDILDDVILEGAGRDLTLLYGGSDRILHIQAGNYVTINNMTLFNGEPRSNPPIAGDTGGGALSNWGHTVVHNVLFNLNESSKGDHVYNGAGAELYIYDSDFETDVYTRQSHPIYNAGYIELNRVKITGHFGILYALPNSTTVFTNVIATNNGYVNDGFANALVPISQNAQVFVNYSTFFDNSEDNLFYTWDGSSQLTLNNSIVMHSQYLHNKPCGVPQGTSIHMIGMNILSSTDCDQTGNTAHRIIVDPLLDANFQPSIGSPAIDAAVGCIADDYYGTARPLGSLCDIGAVESIYIPMDAPTDLAGTVNYQNIDLTWQDNANYETSYVVERSLDNSDWSIIATLPADSESYSDSGLACFTSYYYRVSSQISIAKATSNTISLTTTCSPLNAPTNLHTVSTASTLIELAWQDNNTTESGFHILRQISGSSWESISTIGADFTDFIDNTVTCETDYNYQVQVFRTGDSSTVDSNLLEVSSGMCPLDAPILFTTSTVTENSMNLTWLDQSDLESAYLLLRSSDGVSYEPLANLAADTQSYSDTTLACETTYWYQLQAYRAEFDIYSPIVQTSATTSRCSVQAPDEITPMNVTRNSSTVTWHDSSPQETTHIVIERALESAGASALSSGELDWKTIATIVSSNTSYNDNDLQCGLVYWYRVRGFDEVYQEYSDYSDPIQIVTLPCPVPVTNTIGLYQNGLWTFRDSFDNSGKIFTFPFGPREAGWIPLTGDWNGDGVDGIGLYKNGIFLLRDISDKGAIDYVARFGKSESGWLPVVGDWNGDDLDTIGVYKDGVFILSNALQNPSIDYQFIFGKGEAGWMPIAGDWRGSGQDYVGLYKNGMFALHTTFKTQRNPSIFIFGPMDATWMPIAGDWNQDNISTIGVYREHIWRLKNSNSGGNVDIGFSFGNFSGTAYPLASYRGGGEALEALAFFSVKQIELNTVDNTVTVVPTVSEEIETITETETPLPTESATVIDIPVSISGTSPSETVTLIPATATEDVFTATPESTELTATPPIPTATMATIEPSPTLEPTEATLVIAPESTEVISP